MISILAMAEKIDSVMFPHYVTAHSLSGIVPVPDTHLTLRLSTCV